MGCKCCKDSDPKRYRECQSIIDCIYFEEKEKDTGWNHCINSHRLDNKDILCDMCRLFDSYIPNNSTLDEIEKAQKWQRMSYLEQSDYDDYFSV